jgi:rod shape-determining protein MreD
MTGSLRIILFAAADTLRACLVILVAALVQVTVMTDIVVLGGHPDLIVIVVVTLGLLRGPIIGALAGFAAGFLVDALGLGVIGATSLALVGVGYVAGLFAGRGRGPIGALAAVAAASVFASLTELLIAALVGADPSIAASLVFAVIPTAMLNVLIAIMLMPALRRVLLLGTDPPPALPA